MSDIRKSFGEIDSFLYMCIENIPVIRTSFIGYKNMSDISLIPDNFLITGIIGVKFCPKVTKSEGAGREYSIR